MSIARLRLTLLFTVTRSVVGGSITREEWALIGGSETDQEASFTLYVKDAEVDRRVSNYGGSVDPRAFGDLFEVSHPYGKRLVQITPKGLALRRAELDRLSYKTLSA